MYFGHNYKVYEYETANNLVNKNIRIDSIIFNEIANCEMPRKKTKTE